MAVHLHVLPAGPIQTNAYLLTEPARGEAMLIRNALNVAASLGFSKNEKMSCMAFPPCYSAAGLAS